MTEIEKFYTDVERIKKHDRIDNINYNGLRVCRKISNYFLQNNKIYGDLSKSIVDYWMSEYIEKSDIKDEEPTNFHIEKLVAIKSFLDNTNETEVLSENDWKHLADFVNYEAENIPIDDLSTMMSVLLEKGII